MREIEFKGKDIKNGELVYGFLRYSCAENSYYIDYEYKESYESSAVWLFDKVDPKTIGQYTGLKDKNGTKIFEGDILELQGTYEEIDGSLVKYLEIHEIKYENTAFYAYNSEMHPYWTILNELVKSLKETETYRVIGNIHDNPELLQN